MDENDIKTNLLIENYLQGKLTEEEAAAFEERFLSSDELLDELEAAELARQGLKDVAALERTHEPEKPRSNVIRLFQSPQYAMAASFMLLLSLGVSTMLLQQNARLSDGEPVQVLPTEILPLVSVRSSAINAPINKLKVGDTPKQFVFMLDPGYENYSYYRASLYRMDISGEKIMVWRVDELVPGYEEMLALSVPGTGLRPGNYEILIEGWRDNWAQDHLFDKVDTVTFEASE